MGKQGIHRYPANSKGGRQVAAITSPLRTGLVELTQEQKDWNARVDAKKAEKQRNRL